MKLNRQQHAAVIHRDGPILILAGAGSGKTRVIVNRIARMILEENIPAWQILAVTFTNKAANEMKERVEAFDAIQSPSGVNIGTFHSICVRILRREHDKLGYHSNFTICDDSQQIARIKKAMQTTNANSDKMKPKSLQAMISKAKNAFISPIQFLDEAGENPYRMMGAKVYKAYEDGLKNDHAMDFDDLIVKVVQLLKNEPEVLNKYQNRYRYIMIDEYQDTNHAQYELVMLLSEKYRNIMAVGDDDQSIYRWRGAEVSNILNFARDFPGAKTIKLEQNYRSTQVILAAAGSLMTRNRTRHAKKLWTENAGGDKVSLSLHGSDRDEARWVAERITSQIQAENRSYKDFAVFYRINAQSRVIEETFQTLRIPHQIIGNISFFKRKEIKDLLAYIQLVLNPYDSGACRRIINVPKRGIGKTTISSIEKLGDQNNLDLFSAVDHAVNENVFSAYKANHLTKFRDLINELIRFERTHDAKEFVDKCLALTGYKEQFTEDRSVEAMASLEIVREFENAVADFAQRTQGSLADFADYLALHTADENDDDQKEQDKVQVMTLHNAKGLEFPVVFVVGLEEGISPLLRSDTEISQEDIEEERRLLYVGMTRAKEKLHLSGSATRFLHGKSKQQQVSRFVDEISDEFIDDETIRPEPELSLHTSQPSQRFSKNYSSSYNQQSQPAASSLKTPITVVRDFNVGDRVRHGKWGVGTIVNCSGTGPKTKIDIKFDRFGRKKLVAGYARLVKLN